MAGQLIKFSKEKNALQINYCASLTQNHSWKNANDQKKILPLLSQSKKKFTINKLSHEGQKLGPALTHTDG